MKFLKAIAILLLGPLLGIPIAFILGGLALPPDPKFVAHGGHAAPGDGFLILPYLLVSLMVTVPVSILAGVVLLRKPNAHEQIETP